MKSCKYTDRKERIEIDSLTMRQKSTSWLLFLSITSQKFHREIWRTPLSLRKYKWEFVKPWRSDTLSECLLVVKKYIHCIFPKNISSFDQSSIRFNTLIKTLVLFPPAQIQNKASAAVIFLIFYYYYFLFLFPTSSFPSLHLTLPLKTAGEHSCRGLNRLR